MPTFTETSAPPPYPTFAPYGGHGLKPGLKILPREDEGREELPPYSNDISLRAIMPRKMEFIAPGVQARDRKWRRVMVVLEGTMLKIYRCPVGPGGVSAIEQWWESKVGAGDTSSFQMPPPVPPPTAKPEAREEEKVKQQYLRNPLNTEPSLASGSRTGEQPRMGPGTVKAHEQSGSGVTVTKSALNLAVHFLKTGAKQHGRSNSDLGPPPSPGATGRSAPRASLNLPTREDSPRPSSSRSTTPLPSTSSNASLRSATPSSSGSRRPVKTAKKRTDLEDPNPNDLIRCYTMQRAESGLGNDYVKRKNVIRVRLEGEQFLLQASDVKSVVEWIEVRAFYEWVDVMLMVW